MKTTRVAGQFRLTRSSSMTRDDAGVNLFVMYIKTDLVHDFPEQLQVHHPEAIFVISEGGYDRLATVEDILNIPAFEPDTPNGDYRVTSNEKSFSKVTEGLGWARTVYENANSLVLLLQDYASAFVDVVEETLIPDDYTTSLYNAIQEYNKAVDNVDVLTQTLKVKKAELEVLDKVQQYTSGSSSVIAADNSLELLRSSLPQLYNALISITAQLKHAIGLEGASTSLLRNASNGITSVLGSSETAAGIKPALNNIKAQINNFMVQMTSSADGLDLFKKLLLASGLMQNGVLGAVEKLNIINTINTTELAKLRNTLTRDITAVELQIEEAIQDKQVKWTVVIAINDKVDPLDPMSFFNYRVFNIPS